MWKPKKRQEERQAYEKILLLVGEAMLAQLDMMEELFEEARAGLDLTGVENEVQRNPMIFLLVKDLRGKLPPMESA